MLDARRAIHRARYTRYRNGDQADMRPAYRARARPAHRAIRSAAAGGGARRAPPPAPRQRPPSSPSGRGARTRCRAFLSAITFAMKATDGFADSTSARLKPSTSCPSAAVIATPFSLK